VNSALGSSQIVWGRSDIAQFLRRMFWCDIALRRSQQFKANHKLPDTSGPEKRQEKVRVEMPFIMLGFLD